MNEDIRNILERMVQVGKVHSVDNVNHRARVKFEMTGIMSGWLYVLDNRPAIPDYDIPQQTESKSGGAGDSAFEEHSHDLVIRQWMPKVNDVVVCLYLPIRNSDGFILGGIK